MIKPEFMMERNGKQFVIFAGLLDEAHQQGLKEIRTTLLQIPTDENSNVAICYAEVTTGKGTFCALGDASPSNVSRAMLTCLIRMAETRAKARALRDAVNVGVVSLEELDNEGRGDDDDRPASPPVRSGRPAAQERPVPAPRQAAPAGAITRSQMALIENLAQRTGRQIDLAGMSSQAAAQLITSLRKDAGGPQVH